MFNASHKDFACLLNVLESIEKIKQYSVDCSNSDDFFSESKTFDAALMNFIIIGEIQMLLHRIRNIKQPVA